MEGGPGVCPLTYRRPTRHLECAREGDSTGSDSSPVTSMTTAALVFPLLRGVGLLLTSKPADDSRLALLLRLRFGGLEKSSSSTSSWPSLNCRGRACPRSRSFSPCGRSSSILNETL